MLKEPIIKKDKPTTIDEGERRPKWFAIGYDDHKLYYVGTWDCSEEAYQNMKRLHPDVLCSHIAADELVKSWMLQIGIVLDGNDLYSIPNEEVPEESQVRKEDHSKMMKFFALGSDVNLYYTGIYEYLDDAWCAADEMWTYDKKSRNNVKVYDEGELLQWRSLVNTILGDKGFYQTPNGRSHEEK
jgi:hypothetical protein